MTADLLHRAATLIRERAQAANPGAWSYLGSSTSSEEYGHQPGSSAAYLRDDESGDVFSVDSGHFGRSAVDDAAHIASWHPAVALAVADWLDEQATTWDYNERAWTAGAADPRNRWAERGLTVESNLAHFHRHALAVADAYLGEEV